jgi:hypothetical protein
MEEHAKGSMDGRRVMRFGNGWLMKKLFCQSYILVGAVVLMLWPSSVNGRLTKHWDLKIIADEAQALVAGEVLEVKNISQSPKEQAESGTAPIRKTAKIRVLRLWPKPDVTKLTEGQDVDIEFYAEDPERPLMVDGYAFPEIFIGDTTVFPLRKVEQGGEIRWEILADEGWGLLIPCAKASPSSTDDKSAFHFLHAELAGALARGTYHDVYRAAQYLTLMGSPDADSLAELEHLVEDTIGDSQERWFDIAVACYCTGSWPIPKILEIGDSPARVRGNFSFTIRALRRVDTEQLVDRFLARAIEHLKEHANGTAGAILTNGSRNPVAVRLLNECLLEDRPEALYAAYIIVRDKEHPILATALAAAVKMLLQPYKKEDFIYLNAACGLIRSYGSEDDFKRLLDEIARTKRADREKFFYLWQACAYALGERQIPIIRLYIDEEESPFKWKTRFCDTATVELQRVTGQDFGMSGYDLDKTERDKAVAKARAWLLENYPERDAKADGKQK